ncbi:MAG: hypothetical protein ACRCYU_12420 [Nocardioides sp.]
MNLLQECPSCGFYRDTPMHELGCSEGRLAVLAPSPEIRALREGLAAKHVQVARVEQLAESWESATNLSDGSPSIVMRALARELREALEVPA